MGVPGTRLHKLNPHHYRHLLRIPIFRLGIIVGMFFPSTKKFCCCCSLKTGIFIIGAIELILYIGILAYFSVGIMVRIISSTTPITFSLAFAIAIAIILVPIICHIVVSSLLIHGAKIEQPGFLTPWIVVIVILFTLNTLSFLYMMMAQSWNIAVINSIIIGVYVYPFIVVQSFKKQLETSNGKCPPLYKV